MGFFRRQTQQADPAGDVDYQVGFHAGHPDRFSIHQYRYDIGAVGRPTVHYVDQLWAQAEAGASQAEQAFHQRVAGSMEDLRRIQAGYNRAVVDRAQAEEELTKADPDNPPPDTVARRNDARRRIGEAQAQASPYLADVTREHGIALSTVGTIWSQTKARVLSFWRGLCDAHPEGAQLAMRPPTPPAHPDWTTKPLQLPDFGGNP